MLSRHTRALALLLASGSLLSACTSTPKGPVDETGALATGDKTLSTGELMDAFPVSVKAGQWIRVELHSTAFDPYLILRMPGGTASENDDAVEFDSENSQILFHVTQAGQYEIGVTTYKPGQDGAYTLRYEVSDTELQPARNPKFNMTGRFERSGTLEHGDRTLRTGEIMDAYPLYLTAGQQIRIRLHSDSFDPYLILKKPEGEGDPEENDDATQGDTHNSEIIFRAEHDGQYPILVTTYSSGESGAYTLTVDPVSGAAAAPGGKPADPRAPSASSGADSSDGAVSI